MASDEIVFTQGVPALSEDLREISPKFHNVLVFDDLMSKATDSPVLSTLFTQGRHHFVSGNIRTLGKTKLTVTLGN